MVVNLTRQEREALEDIFKVLKYQSNDTSLLTKILQFLTNSINKLF